MKAGWTISAVGHVAVLAWVVAFATGRWRAAPDCSEDIISLAISAITNGQDRAQAEVPKPLARGREANREEQTPRSSDKPEIGATADQVSAEAA